ncbi:hypothetical protein [Kordiimonas sp. SCSIO 12610]|uniref:hypothetical protein n=1 Tax=Kordiimonas sp. SCSIO 12610 TaxID=2829597 RepID=UPI00210D3711|nr:hypothetical protein [Kordiimonas sp. SCSIO 12610]UTW56084.1 hypothetical protein KFF44_04100 [Kordiimonas sp. SCSIO 12610]
MNKMENISGENKSCLTLGADGRLFGGGVHDAASEMPIYVDTPTFEANLFESEKHHRALVAKLRNLRAYIKSVS